MTEKILRVGAIDYWTNEVESLSQDPDALNEFYRQFPELSLMHLEMRVNNLYLILTKIYQQIDYNDSLIMEHHTTRGSFQWENGVKDTKGNLVS